MTNGTTTSTTFFIEEITDEDDADGIDGGTPSGLVNVDKLRKRDKTNVTRPFVGLLLPTSSASSFPDIGGGSTLTLVGSKLYSFGGCSRAGQPSGELRCFDLESNLWWDDANSKVSPKEITLARFGHTIIEYESKLYLFGGQGLDPLTTTTSKNSDAVSFDNSPPVSFNDLYMLNTLPSSRTWTALDHGTPEDESALEYYGQETRPMPRNSHSAVRIGDKMYVFGGSNEEVGPMRDVWSLDLQSSKWERLDSGEESEGDAPEAREMHAACSIPLNHDVNDNRSGMLIMGGRKGDGTACDDCWVYDTRTRQWKRLSGAGTTGLNRCAHTAEYLPKDNLVAVFGGWDCAGKIYQDLICFDIKKKSWVNTSLPFSRPVAAERFAHSACADSDGNGLYILGGVNAQCDLKDLIHIKSDH